MREITHIPGEENDRCDRLSRRGSSPAMSITEEVAEMGIVRARVIEMNRDESVMGIIDPIIVLESESEFVMILALP